MQSKGGKLKNVRSALIVAAHPDDEILGCGGTIARHSEVGDLVRVIIVSTGITSRSNTISSDINKEELAALKMSAEKANQTVGVKSVDFLNYPDNRLDSIQRLDLIKDLWEFMKVRKKFWMAPILMILLLLGSLLVFTQGSAVAPFIYTLF